MATLRQAGVPGIDVTELFPNRVQGGIPGMTATELGAQPAQPMQPGPARMASAPVTPAAPPVAPAPPNAFQRIAPTLRRAAPVAGAGAAVWPELVATARVRNDPNSTPLDVATQASEGAARVAGGGLGALGGAGLGATLGAMTGPLAPVAVPVGGIAGAALGAWGGTEAVDKTIRTARNWLGQDPSSPADRAVAAPVNMPPPVGGQAQVRALDNTAAGQAGINSAVTPTAAQPPRTQSDLSVPDPNKSQPGSPDGITRVGNSFSGNFAPTAAAPVDENALGGRADTLRRLASLEASNAQTAAQARGPAVIDNGDPNRNADFNDSASLRTALARTTTSRRGTTVDPAAEGFGAQLTLRQRDRQAQTQAQVERERNQAQVAVAAQRDATDRRGQDVQAAAAAQRDATDRRGQDVTLRGQDVTLRGQDVTARTAAQAARLDQMNKDRTFKAEADKTAFAQDKDTREMLQRADKAANERIKTWVSTGNKEQDEANAARYTVALNSHIAGQIRNLEQEVTKNPSNTQAAMALRELRTKGADAMPIDEQQKFIAGVRANEVAQANNSFIGNTAVGNALGIGGRAPTTDAPIRTLRRVERTLMPDYYTDGTDNVRIPASAVDYVPGTGFLGFGRQRNNNFDTLRQK